MGSAAEYIEALQAAGSFTFTTEDAARALGTSASATRAALRRLKSKDWIADPYRGFHVVVPPAYRRLGCLPAEQFIPDLMDHLDEPYYVALLSAAAYHGAAHHAPMVFQVMLRGARRDIECGQVRVQLVSRRDMEGTPVELRNTETGVIRVATPEATAVEVVGYPDRAGYLDNVATVLAELAESLDAEALALEARRAPVAWTQRLGYLLSLVGEDALAESVERVVRERDSFPVALAPWNAMTGAPRDPRWRVVVNARVEPDL